MATLATDNMHDISLTKEGGSDWVANLTVLDADPKGFDLYVSSATPVLALCAVPLKARTLTKEQERK